VSHLVPMWLALLQTVVTVVVCPSDQVEVDSVITIISSLSPIIIPRRRLKG
jgi:hypothetical protein